MLKAIFSKFVHYIKELAEFGVFPITEFSRDLAINFYSPEDRFFRWAVWSLPLLLATAFFLVLASVGITAVSMVGVIVCLAAAIADCLNVVGDAIHRRNAVVYDIENPRPAVAVVKDKNNFKEYVQEYIDSFKDKKPHRTRMNELSLIKPFTQDELAKLEKHIDQIISMRLINIPVFLHDRVYDLEDLEKLLAQNKPDPVIKRPFDRSDISSARIVNEKINRKLNEISAARQLAPANVVRHHSMTKLHPSITHFKPATQSHSTDDIRLLELSRISPLRR